MPKRSPLRVKGNLDGKKLLPELPDWPPEALFPRITIEHPDARFSLRFRLKRFDGLYGREELKALKLVIDEALGLSKS